MFESHPISACLLMAGLGARFHSHKPKQFHLLSGKKIYLHTLEIFLELDVFDEIILVCPKEHLDEVQNDIKNYHHSRLIVTEGGPTRQASSYQGTQACLHHDIIMIHDAVRPFVSKEILLDNIKKAISHEACDTCIPSHDTIVFTKTHAVIDSIPSRNHLMRGQTPQTFSHALLLKAHKKALEDHIEEASDDCQLVQRLGIPVAITLGSDDNIKITTEFDFLLAQQLLRKVHILKTISCPLMLKGKTFAITGGSGGIGSALMNLLKNEGATSLNLSRSSSDYKVDLTSEKQTQETFNKLYETHGAIDGLINCIGYLKTSRVSSLKGQDIRKMIASNFTSIVYASKYCKLKKGAHLINIASSSFSKGRADYAVYSSMKAAIVNFTQGLSLEHPELYINAIIPSRTNTSMRKDNFKEESEEFLLQPDDVAKTILEMLKQQMTGTLVDLRKT